jgi:uncharacterized protein (DUF1800 family)
MTTSFSLIHKITAALLLLAFSAPAFAISTDTKTKSKPLTEDQKILHVLNRLGFGARPGDVEKVKAMGLQKYIDLQLNPDKIDDSVADSKIKGLDVLNMSTADLFAKYPNPGALLRTLEGGRKGQAKKADAKNAGAAGDDKTMVDGKTMADGTKANDQPKDDAQLTNAEQKERQAKIRDLYIKYDLRPPNQIMQQQISARVLRGVYSERQLEEVMTDFWANHFNVYSGKAAVRWYIPSYERDVLRKNALGNFKDLLAGTAQHPAMLFYLDNFESVSPTAQPQKAGNARLQEAIASGNIPPRMRERLKDKFGVNDQQLDERLKQMKANGGAKKAQKRGINENYARELMELHTLGVDGGYTQKDVQEVARCFTGWTIVDPRGYRKSAANIIKGTDDQYMDRLQRQLGIPDSAQSGDFFFNPRWHDGGEKTVLGQKINEGGMKDGLKVLDILVNSPATAKFIARKLAVKFVSDNPSDALVNHVADAFHKSQGDIKTTLRALFGDPEFFAAENYHAKIKTPFELMVSAIRAVGADTSASPALLAFLQKMGEVPYGYQAPTGYPDTAQDWVNTGALLERMNFAVAFASNRIPRTTVDLTRFDGKDKQQILDKAAATILGGEIAPNTRAMLLKQAEQPLIEPKLAENTEMDGAMMMTVGQGGGGGKRQGQQARLLPPSGNPEVFKVVGLLLGSPDFQRQ